MDLTLDQPLNPENPVDVLAFILCPAEAFAGTLDDVAAIRELLRPVKDAAIKRWENAVGLQKRS